MTNTKCAVCEQCIVDGRDQALLCEGYCDCWHHRYCAGVSLPQYERLSSSEEPFYCAVCVQERYTEELSELRKTVTLLRDEITHLRADLEAKDGVCTGKHCGVCGTSIESDEKNADIVMSRNGGMGNEGGASGAGSRGGGRRNGGCKGGGKGGAGRKGSGGKGSGGQGSAREGNNICYSDSNIRQNIKIELVFVPYLRAESMAVTIVVTHLQQLRGLKLRELDEFGAQ